VGYSSILLIDDDEDDQEIFLAAVEEISTSATCIAYNNARIALQKLENSEISVDIIFLDLNMPIMNGTQFLIAFMKNDRLRKIPVIVLSTSSQPLAIHEAKSLGATDFITKPADYLQLKNILFTILA
jgi:CheY-like chemotaxis protein